ncbi:formate dehydrogenase accessory sulfurtransferase FdhD [Larsenimonas suaedae]|uniref:Formate dehydrogenase accessory sulfurtransferase FdhD n=1 Tax=Larsenimonas suaedae TaxID=1851019 RepID=A0ABU1GSS6_9GAMM|nr:formate dehydrogenase accessory sulfurtransferase FdhD [Larsenimonas suaedae]MCM2972142.1 formate dehydrogenase accessory sulfurtransferase FdhD [Larsenimonas suaedae]MDR5895064.1 formate dehydrogenase accessory sulfurtransferase FdhD [Larsenimonas suaedae]
MSSKTPNVYEWAVDLRPESLNGPEEQAVTLALNEMAFASVLASPEDLEAWATGFAFSEGLIRHVSQIEAIDQRPLRHGHLVRLTVPEHLEAQARERRRVGASTSSCGRCGTAEEGLMFEGLRQLPPAGLPAPEQWQTLLEALNARSQAGYHVALGVDDQARLTSGRDIGRHNALDKLLGKGLLGTMPQTVLISSRCSLELIQKSVRAGVTSLGTLSLPSTLAVETARLCGLNLICCHRGHRLQLLSRGRDPD